MRVKKSQKSNIMSSLLIYCNILLTNWVRALEMQQILYAYLQDLVPNYIS